MPEFITLEEAARITGFPSQEIQQWAISKKITSYVVKQGVRLVDLTNLREFISHIERNTKAIPATYHPRQGRRDKRDHLPIR